MTAREEDPDAAVSVPTRSCRQCGGKLWMQIVPDVGVRMRALLGEIEPRAGKSDEDLQQRRALEAEHDRRCLSHARVVLELLANECDGLCLSCSTAKPEL